MQSAMMVLFASMLLACPPPSHNYMLHVACLLTSILHPGLPPFGGGDAHLLRPYRPIAIHMAPQALHLHLGEPYNSEAAVWHEGMIRYD